MSSDYMKINEKNYLSKMIQEAEKKADSKKGSKLSINDAREIFKGLSSDSLEETEARTVSYILEKYSFTEPALKWIEKILSQSDNYGDIHNAEYTDKEDVNYEEAEKRITGLNAKEEKPLFLKKLIILLIIFAALIAAAGFFLIKKEKSEPLFTKAEDDKISASEEPAVEKEASDKIDANQSTPLLKEEATDLKPHSKLYIVKDKDTLIKISIDVFGDYSRWKEIYNLNKNELKDPALLFPGQEIKLPEN